MQIKAFGGGLSGAKLYTRKNNPATKHKKNTKKLDEIAKTLLIKKNWMKSPNYG